MSNEDSELQLAKLKNMDENFRKRGEWRYPERAAIRRAVGTIKVLLNQVHNLTEQGKRSEAIIDDLEMMNATYLEELQNLGYYLPKGDGDAEEQPDQN